jgi:hypothetical protein
MTFMDFLSGLGAQVRASFRVPFNVSGGVFDPCTNGPQFA